MRLDDFEFPLPEELVALEPATQGRDTSKLMVLQNDAPPVHSVFSSLPDYLKPGDMLVINNTRVLPCRIIGTRKSGAPIEVLLVKEISTDGTGKQWEVMSKGGYTGEVKVDGPIKMTLKGGVQAELEFEGDLRDVLDTCGVMPLPPYIHRPADERDRKWYQTVYAKHTGSIAAPTAGLHFTPQVLDALKAKGVLVRTLTLHVGRGTFTPVRAELLKDHSMEKEFFTIPNELLNEIKNLKGRLIAVGTTTTRTLEGFFSNRYEPAKQISQDSVSGSTDIFITPGYEFKAVEGLITNFHLPRSTPLMLASAFTGRERLLSAYEEAVKMKYRFFSYGDSMLIHGLRG